MISEPFHICGAHYDLFYQDKDYAAETAYITQTLQSVGNQGNRLLEFGSGTGKHGRLLAARGFDVLGVERSRAMIDAASGSSLESISGSGSFKCVQGDIRTIELSERFNAVLALFHVMSYQADNADLLRTFENAARHLLPNGLFLFDVWHGPAVLSQRPTVRVKRVEDEEIRLTRIAEPKLDVNAGIVTVQYTVFAESKTTGSVKQGVEEHRMRYLFPTEIALMAQQTNFEVLRSEEFLTGLPASESSWGVAYLLRKRN